MTRFLTSVLAAVVLLAFAGPARAQYTTQTDKDSATRAKALLLLGCTDKSECHLAKKAADLLVVAKSQALAADPPAKAVAPAPKLTSNCPSCEKGECSTGDCRAGCKNGTCPINLTPSVYPVLPGYERGSDGIYRRVGVAPGVSRR